MKSHNFLPFSMSLSFVVCILLPVITTASVTKVGNGDDGKDLEALTAISSGHIFDTRILAIDVVKKLNVSAIEGLGTLMPELQKTEMFMARHDVHPKGDESGTLELAAGENLIFARTFALPYAATRFFPAALKLTSEQLISLHIHEALHRSLPPDIRENEDIVMNFTLAITSPGATHDRIRQVAKIYIVDSDFKNKQLDSPETRASDILTESSHTVLKYSYEHYSNELGSELEKWVHGLEYDTPVFGTIRVYGLAFQSSFRARIKVVTAPQKKTIFGPSSYELRSQLSLSEMREVGFFGRFTAKTFDESYYFNDDRDLLTLGSSYSVFSNEKYIVSEVSYAFASRSKLSRLYKPILSFSSHFGFDWKRIKMGMLAEVVSSESTSDAGSGASSFEGDSFRLYSIGPELGAQTGQLKLALFYKWILNETQRSFSDLNDIMDHGLGRAGVGFSAAVSF